MIFTEFQSFLYNITYRKRGEVMKSQRYLLEEDQNFTFKAYEAKIYKCPDQFDLYEACCSYHFQFHWHKDYEFIYVNKGPFTVRKHDGDVILNDGDVYILNNEELHLYPEMKREFEILFINIPTNLIDPYFHIPEDSPAFVIDNETAKVNILHVSKLLYNLKGENDKFVDFKVKSIVNYILYHLMKYCYKPDLKYSKGSDSSDFNCAKKAIRYMEENYKKDISLSEIAGHVAMAPSHFSKYFRDKTETTFSKYLRRIRLDHAVSDMRENNASVKDAAQNNGFPNLNAFISTCKEIYGKTPNEMKLLISE